MNPVTVPIAGSSVYKKNQVDGISTYVLERIVIEPPHGPPDQGPPQVVTCELSSTGGGGIIVVPADGIKPQFPGGATITITLNDTHAT